MSSSRATAWRGLGAILLSLGIVAAVVLYAAAQIPAAASPPLDGRAAGANAIGGGAAFGLSARRLTDVLFLAPPASGLAVINASADSGPLSAAGRLAGAPRPADRSDPVPVVMPIPGAGFEDGFGAQGPMWAVAHSGLDFSAGEGTPAVAVVSGTVRAIFMHPSYGWVVQLVRADGVAFWYAHLSQALVEPGQEVRQGQTIALTGATGNVTGPHLHFEVRVGSVPTDPAGFLYDHPGVPSPAPGWAYAYRQEPPPGHTIIGWPSPKKKDPKARHRKKGEMTQEAGTGKKEPGTGPTGSPTPSAPTQPESSATPSPTPTGGGNDAPSQSPSPTRTAS